MENAGILLWMTFLRTGGFLWRIRILYNYHEPEGACEIDRNFSKVFY